MTLVEFLLARITEDEIIAGTLQVVDDLLVAHGEDAGRTPLLSPARALAECAAKRKIIKLVDEYQTGHISDDFAGDVMGDEILSDLASVYADHPDYQQEWTA
jgi:Family of unknown function (DUF6221)